MWLYALCYTVILITSSSSNPLKNDLQDETDGFYTALRSALDKIYSSRPRASEPLADPFLNRANHLAEGVLEDYKKDDTDPEQADQFHEQSDNSHGRVVLPPEVHDVPSGLNPLYQCDKFEVLSHTCTNIRQIGTTLTLGIQMDVHETQNQLKTIRWYRYFKRLGTLSDVHEEFTRDNLPWNINIGGKSNELRISPITEIDYSFNYFVATVSGMPEEKSKKSLDIQFIKFVIEPINIDMGILYPGEELVIYSRAFMALPMNSVTFRWTLNNSEFGLPSNMKVNEDGSSVIVKELRTSIDKVLTCSVYSNKNVFLAKRSFLFRKIGGNENAKQEHPNFLHSFHLLRKKRSLEDLDLEGFVDDEDKDLERPRQYLTKSYGASEFNLNNQIDHYNDDKPYSHTQDRFLNDVERYNYYPKLESQDNVMNFNPGKVNTYRFSKPKSSGHFPLEDENVVVSEDINPDFSHKANRFRFKSHRKESPIEDGAFVNDYHKNQYNSRSKKDLNRFSFEDEARSKNEESDQLDELIQQANLMVQTTTESYLRKVEAVAFDTNQRLSFDDEESVLISICKNNNDCSIHATCFKKSDGLNFCRCFSQYKGNGIFCWLV